jgi:hypothetical protein
MVKVSIYALLLGIALAGGISTGAEAQDYVVHTFRCPDNVSVRTNYERKIGSDPSFSLEGNRSLTARLSSSGWEGQNVYCSYRFTIGGVTHSVRYGYTVKRKILSCKGSSSPRFFTCNLKP